MTMAGTIRTRHSYTTPERERGYVYSLTGNSGHGMSSPPNPLPPGDYSMGYTDQTTEDVPHTGYRKRIAAGEIINSPFSSSTERLIVSPPGTYVHAYKKVNGLLCNAHTPSQSHDLLYQQEGRWRANTPTRLKMDSVLRGQLLVSVMDQAVVSAQANIDTSEMKALATVAESGKTIDSAKNILFRAYKIAKSVRKLNIRELRNEISPGELTDRWMEARYAIRPLVYDLHGIAAAVQANNGCFRRTFRGTKEYSGTIQGTSLTGITLATYLLGDWNRSVEYSISARAGVLCDVNVTELSTFGVDQIAETAWELVPWSFVFDWFANTGDWIAAHTPNAGVRQLASWVTTREHIRGIHTLVNVRSTAATYGYAYPSFTVPPHRFEWEELVLTRHVDPITCTFPSFRMKLDEYKLTDLGIMLRNLFLK